MPALMTIKVPDKGFVFRFYPVRQGDGLQARAQAQQLAQLLDAATGNDRLSLPARNELLAQALARAEQLQQVLEAMFAEEPPTNASGA